jgi:hypothetical protein
MPEKRRLRQWFDYFTPLDQAGPRPEVSLPFRRLPI